MKGAEFEALMPAPDQVILWQVEDCICDKGPIMNDWIQAPSLVSDI